MQSRSAHDALTTSITFFGLLSHPDTSSWISFDIFDYTCTVFSNFIALYLYFPTALKKKTMNIFIYKMIYCTMIYENLNHMLYSLIMGLMGSYCWINGTFAAGPSVLPEYQHICSKQISNTQQLTRRSTFNTWIWWVICQMYCFVLIFDCNLTITRMCLEEVVDILIAIRTSISLYYGNYGADSWIVTKYRTLRTAGCRESAVLHCIERESLIV